MPDMQRPRRRAEADAHVAAPRPSAHVAASGERLVIADADQCRRGMKRRTERDMHRLTGQRARIDRGALCSVIEEIGHLPWQSSKIAGQCDAYRVAPGSAACC